MCLNGYEEEDIKPMRKVLYGSGMKTSARRDKLYRLLQGCLVRDTANNKRFLQYKLDDETIVCKSAFAFCYGLRTGLNKKEDSYVFKKVRNMLLKGQELPLQTRPQPKPAPMKESCLSWLRGQWDKAESPPNLDSRILPDYTSFQFYTRYMKDPSVPEHEKVKFSRFCVLWHRKFKKLHCKSLTRADFGRCDDCTYFETQRKNRHLSDDEHIEMEEARDLHLMTQQRERDVYYDHRRIGRETFAGQLPLDQGAVSLIVDFMEQAKTDLPHFVRSPKGLKEEMENALPLAVLGILVHGYRHYAFVVPPWVGAGADTIIECISQVLADLPAQHARKLYIQFDNATENKCRATFGFLGSLVHSHRFDEVEVGCLLVGHTHEDVDQWFSVLGDKLKPTVFVTPEELGYLLRTAHSDPALKANVRHLKYRHNFTEWLDGSTSKFGGEKVPHAFHIFRNNGEVYLEYKLLAAMPKWDSKHVFRLFPENPPRPLAELDVAAPRDWNEAITKEAVNTLLQSPLLEVTDDHRTEYENLWKEAAHDYSRDNLPTLELCTVLQAQSKPVDHERRQLCDKYIPGEPLMHNEIVKKSEVASAASRRAWIKSSAEKYKGPFKVNDDFLVVLDDWSKFSGYCGIVKVMAVAGPMLHVRWYDCKQINGKWYYPYKDLSKNIVIENDIEKETVLGRASFTKSGLLDAATKKMISSFRDYTGYRLDHYGRKLVTKAEAEQEETELIERYCNTDDIGPCMNVALYYFGAFFETELFCSMFH